MPATVYVVARYLAKPGKEREVEGILTALVTPSRREIGCYQYDLLRNASDPCDFCFVERWGDDRAIDQHTATEHVKNTIEQVGGLVEVPPDIRRYLIL